MKERVLVITGMHRSGTSLIAQYLGECGLNLGDRIVPANIGNPLGYYEDQDILDFHRKVLKNHKVSEFPTRLRSLEFDLTDGERREAREIVGARSHLSRWGWKEPRTALFLNFWQSCLGGATFLFLVRDPIKVVDSLIRRGTDRALVATPSRALKTWYVYNFKIAAFAAKSPEECLIYEIERAIENPTGLVEALNAKCQIGLNAAADFSRNYKKESFSTAAIAKKAKDLKWTHPILYGRCRELYQKLGNESFKKRGCSRRPAGAPDLHLL